jgi:putative component of toxin-antitoxin plasmid stabilization module
MSQYSEDSQPGEERKPWRLQLLTLPSGQIPYESFRKSLNSYETELLDLCIENILARQGHNVCATNWGKSLGAGLYEFRIRRSLESLSNEFGIELPIEMRLEKSKLLRVFFAVEGQRIILLLAGYDKGKDPSRKRQQKMIKRARTLLKQFNQRT